MPGWGIKHKRQGAHACLCLCLCLLLRRTNTKEGPSIKGSGEGWKEVGLWVKKAESEVLPEKEKGSSWYPHAWYCCRKQWVISEYLLRWSKHSTAWAASQVTWYQICVQDVEQQLPHKSQKLFSRPQKVTSLVWTNTRSCTTHTELSHGWKSSREEELCLPPRPRPPWLLLALVQTPPINPHTVWLRVCKWTVHSCD